MLTLYYSPGACSLAPHIALEWAGASYNAVRVKLGDPDYLKINPAGAVPALDTGEGWTLTQAGAILAHIARLHPKANLSGADNPREKAEIDRWSHFLTGDLHPAFFPYFFPSRYTLSTDAAALAATKGAALKLVEKKLDLIDAHLVGRSFMVGDARTYVDAYLFPMVRWAAKALEGGLSRWPNIAAHHDRMAQDETVKRVLAAEA